MLVSEVLDKCANGLQRYGWCQGEYGDRQHISTGSHCSEGIIFAVTGAANPYFDERIYQLFVAVERILLDANGVEMGVVYFNDNYLKTKKEAVAAFRRAAKLARSRGL